MKFLIVQIDVYVKFYELHAFIKQVILELICIFNQIETMAVGVT